MEILLLSNPPNSRLLFPKPAFSANFIQGGARAADTQQGVRKLAEGPFPLWN